MDHLAPDLAYAAAPAEAADHGALKCPLQAEQIFEGLSLVLSKEEILELHRYLSQRSEDDIYTQAEQCHRSCQSRQPLPDLGCMLC
jgi:hypothetical protein